MTIAIHTKSKIADTPSKGNQEKWRRDNTWYKLDLFGYEGLAEAVASSLLSRINIGDCGYTFVSYRTERIEAHRHLRTGCVSEHFLSPNATLVTLADLFRKGIGQDWKAKIERQRNLRDRISWVVDTTASLTQLDHFGKYLTFLFEADMLFGNEDRHLNNIAVIYENEHFAYAPLFDFGAGLLSNIMERPIDIAPQGLLHGLLAQPFNTTFGRQVRTAEMLYGRQMVCNFTKRDLQKALDESLWAYPSQVQTSYAERVETCVLQQYRRWQNL